MGETRLDETRLREIERQYPAGLSRVGDELIAALRDAWRERDELVAHVQRLTPVNEIVERADRAEAEVKRLGELVKQSQDWLQMYEKDTGFRAKVKALEQVCSAAEAYVRHVQERGAPEALGWKWANLTDAIDAAKDPAR